MVLATSKITIFDVTDFRTYKIFLFFCTFYDFKDNYSLCAVMMNIKNNLFNFIPMVNITDIE